MRSFIYQRLLQGLLSASLFFAGGSAFATTTYTIGVTVTGLSSGAGTLGFSDGSNTLSFTSSDTTEKIFSTTYASGASYQVNISTPPTSPTACWLTSTLASGTVASSNIHLTYACGTTPTAGVTLGGKISGLVTGDSLILQNTKNGDLMTVAFSASTNQAFTFDTALKTGDAYEVKVLAQPMSPTPLYCTVASGSGTAATSNIASIAVTCVAAKTISGTLSGLVGSLTLQNTADNSTLTLTGSSGTTWTWPYAYKTATAYTINVKTPSSNVSCYVAGGVNATSGAVTAASGTIGTTNISGIKVVCGNIITATVTGLSAGTVTLTNTTNTEALKITSSGSSSFILPASGSNSIKLANTGAACSLVSDATAFASALPSPNAYSFSSSSKNIYVTCGNVAIVNTYGLVGGSVPLTVYNPKTAEYISIPTAIAIPASGITGSKAFAVPVGSTYDFVIEPPYPSNLDCNFVSPVTYNSTKKTYAAPTTTFGREVTNSTTDSPKPNGNALALSVYCKLSGSGSNTLGGTVTGLTSGKKLYLSLATPLSTSPESLSISSNGAYQFRASLDKGQGYTASIATGDTATPQVCSINNAGGWISNSGSGVSVNTINPVCAATGHPVVVNVSGLTTAGQVLSLMNNGNDTTSLAYPNDNAVFQAEIANTGTYAVTVATLKKGSAVDTSLVCTPYPAWGTISGGPAEVDVNCAATGYALSGSISGTVATPMLLSINGDLITVPAGATTIAYQLPNATTAKKVSSTSQYQVAIISQPEAQTCYLAATSGASSGSVTLTGPSSGSPPYSSDATFYLTCPAATTVKLSATGPGTPLAVTTAESLSGSPSAAYAVTVSNGTAVGYANTAYNVKLAIPSSWKGSYQDASACTSLASGSSCIINLYSYVPYEPETLSITADNLDSTSKPSLPVTSTLDGYPVYATTKLSSGPSAALTYFEVKVVKDQNVSGTSTWIPANATTDLSAPGVRTANGVAVANTCSTTDGAYYGQNGICATAQINAYATWKTAAVASSAATYAAYQCSTLTPISVSGAAYTAWALPGICELSSATLGSTCPYGNSNVDTLFQYGVMTSITSGNIYWSSTESTDGSQAYEHYFVTTSYNNDGSVYGTSADSAVARYASSATIQNNLLCVAANPSFAVPSKLIAVD